MEPWATIRPLFELGLVEKALEKLAEARAKFETALKVLQSDSTIPRGYFPGLLNCIAETSYDLGDFDKAAKTYELLVDFYPNNDSLHWHSLRWLATCYYDLGQVIKAQTTAERINESSTASKEQQEFARDFALYARIRTAESHYEKEDYRSCIAECEATLPLCREDDEPYIPLLVFLGHSYVAMRNGRLAEKFYSAILSSADASQTQRDMAERCLGTISKPRSK